MVDYYKTFEGLSFLPHPTVFMLGIQLTFSTLRVTVLSEAPITVRCLYQGYAFFLCYEG